MIIKDLVDKLRRLLGERQYAYQKIFKGPLGEVVLKDLAYFCFAHETTFHPDPRAHALSEGRREVWNRIQYHLRLPPNELWELYQGTRKSE